jgi:CheY-like chemotaxis protein
VFVNSRDRALAEAKQKPAVMILDLNNAAVEPLDIIVSLKENPDTSKINLVGFVSHVQVDLKKAAQEKGCDVVIARSAFSQNLPTMLRRYA